MKGKTEMASDDSFHVDYQKLSEVAKIFMDQARCIQDMIKQVSDGKRRLDQTWSGRGYNNFNSEMSSKVFPRLAKLQERLGHASTVVNKIAEAVQAAEKQAQGLFNQ